MSQQEAPPLPPVPDDIREAGRLAPDHWLGVVDPMWSGEGKPPDWAMTGRWRSGLDGEIVEWEDNPDYRPSPRTLGWPEPEDEVDRAVQLASTGYGPGEAVPAALAGREVASYLVSEVVGWDVVPRTWLGDGPHGVGMLQLWQDVDPAQQAVDVVPVDHLPEGWKHVFDGVDGNDQPVSLIHEDSAALRRMAVLDVVLNNADRKGGHVLEMSGGHRHGVDHGLTFHSEPKLRTVLWGFGGARLLAAEREVLSDLARDLGAELGSLLSDLLAVEEVVATLERVERLLTTDRLPRARGQRTIPWPPF